MLGHWMVSAHGQAMDLPGDPKVTGHLSVSSDFKALKDRRRGLPPVKLESSGSPDGGDLGRQRVGPVDGLGEGRFPGELNATTGDCLR